MRLPLFLQTPTSVLDSSLVLLAPGNWVVETDKKDSVLNLSVDGTVYHDIANGFTIALQSSSPARASIVSKGTEKAISLYLATQ